MLQYTGRWQCITVQHFMLLPQTPLWLMLAPTKKSDCNILITGKAMGFWEINLFISFWFKGDHAAKVCQDYPSF